MRTADVSSGSFPRRRGARAQEGISLVEATIVLAVTALLAAAAAPTASRSLDRAKLTRAFNDTAAIRTAIDNLLTEYTTAGVVFSVGGTTNTDAVEMLVSDGDIPGTGIGATTWVTAVSTVYTGEPDVDFLERHLVTNSPGAGGSYSSTLWRGAYINAPIDPDPWGNRYAVNTQYLRSTTDTDVFVLSAGPDEEIDTDFTFATTTGARPGDDDILNVVRRHSGLEVP